MLIGALSLVMLVWLGTSMNCSRRSTRTPRCTIGTTKTQPGPLTSFGLVRPSVKMSEPLVLVDDLDRREEQDQADDDQEQDRRRRTAKSSTWVTLLSRGRAGGWRGAVQRRARRSGRGHPGRPQGPTCRRRGMTPSRVRALQSSPDAVTTPDGREGGLDGAATSRPGHASTATGSEAAGGRPVAAEDARDPDDDEDDDHDDDRGAEESGPSGRRLLLR